ncbi:hypothetical protein CJU89_5748 [Yarrowia sp. B02]|nr:hypothetical protein CJU89_5748 [Yarrowia sp. B02]
MSRRHDSPAESDLCLRGPLSQHENAAFLASLRNMFEFAQVFQFVHFFKRSLAVAEPVEIEVLEEELITCSEMSKLTRQITWALVRANLRIKKKNVDDLELWTMARKVWESHRGEWESREEYLREVEQEDDSANDDSANDQSANGKAKREPTPIEEPPAKRTRSTRSRARADEAAESAAKEAPVVKKEPTPEPEMSQQELSQKSRDLDLRNHQRKVILPDSADYNPFDDSPTLVSNFSRFDAFQLVKIWYQLVQWIMDDENKSRDVVEATLKLTDYKPEELRSEPIGWDSENYVMYLFGDSRLYKRAEKANSSGFDVLDQDIDTWSCVCATWEDWEGLMSQLGERKKQYEQTKKRISKLTKPKQNAAAESADLDGLKYDSDLHAFFARDVIPVVKEVFLEKARASHSRDKERLLEAAMATRKTSSRIQALQAKKEEQDKIDRKEAESREAKKMERRRLERIELQRKQMEERQLARERRFERRNGGRADSAELDESARRRQPRRAAAAAPVTWTFDCVCGIHGENYEDESAMIECETCKTWMHLECLRDRRNVDTESFECDVCGSREEREEKAREQARLEAEKAEKRKRAEEEKLKAEEEKARAKKEKNAQRWQERKKRMKEKKALEEAASRDTSFDASEVSRDQIPPFQHSPQNLTQHVPMTNPINHHHMGQPMNQPFPGQQFPMGFQGYGPPVSQHVSSQHQHSQHQHSQHPQPISQPGNHFPNHVGQPGHMTNHVGQPEITHPAPLGQPQVGQPPVSQPQVSQPQVTQQLPVTQQPVTQQSAVTQQPVTQQSPVQQSPVTQPHAAEPNGHVNGI